jgi:divalent metal cation (Fe/Co/Zn/Cd) transporter
MEGMFVHYHCRFSPGETVDAVHETIDRVDRQLREKMPAIKRVIAHAEPVGRSPHKH